MVINKLANNNDRKLTLSYRLDDDHSWRTRGKKRGEHRKLGRVDDVYG
jgi:hypothetical protein